MGKAGRRFIEHLENANNDANPELLRLALKPATAAGKTTVMAMLIAWQTINAVVEIRGYRGEDAKNKAATMQAYWVPGVNNTRSYGCWAFAEVTDLFQMQADFIGTSKRFVFCRGFRNQSRTFRIARMGD